MNADDRRRETRPPRLALVTGAASGIGLATARRLRSAGWRVVALDRTARPDEDGIEFHELDVTDERAAQDVIARAAGDGADALVCCAGVSGSAMGDGPVGSSTAAAYDEVMRVNLGGTFVSVSAAWAGLEKRRGNVVLVTSVLGLTGGGGPFRSTAYITSKGGMVGLMRTLAAQGRTIGVRVNCVAPGLVDTPLAGRARTDDGVAAYVRSRQPLTGGPIDPDEVAGAIAFLCSADAAAITGQVLAVDAGWGLDPE